MENRISVLKSEFEISQRVNELAGEIWDYYHVQRVGSIEVVQLLEGAAAFSRDLGRAIHRASDGKLEVAIQSMKVGSYNGTESSGEVKLFLDVQEPLQGRHVLVVEDILDTGRSVKYVMGRLGGHEPASLRLCVLLDKEGRRQEAVSADHVGFKIPNLFVVGYGLDYNRMYRNLPFIGVLEPTGK